jgi:hypothetical protein
VQPNLSFPAVPHIYTVRRFRPKALRLAIYGERYSDIHLQDYSCGDLRILRACMRQLNEVMADIGIVKLVGLHPQSA